LFLGEIFAYTIHRTDERASNSLARGPFARSLIGAEEWLRHSFAVSRSWCGDGVVPQNRYGRVAELFSYCTGRQRALPVLSKTLPPKTGEEFPTKGLQEL